MEIIYLLVVCCIILFSCQVDAVYFKLTPGMTKCFLDDVPQGVLLKATIDIIDEIPVLSDTDGVLSTIYHPQSKELIATSREGVYKICLEATSQLFSILPVQEIRVGVKIMNEMEIDKRMQNAISKDDLSESRGYMIEIMSKISEILIEQEYDNRKEEIFVDYQTTLNNKVFWLTIVQIVIVIGSAAWIVINLNSFFKKK